MVAALLARPGLVQFLKFCTVGASNLAIDMAVATTLTFVFHWHWALANTCSFIVAVSNSFYWNRRWTFNDRSKAKQSQRYLLFVTINVVGLGINLTVMKTAMLIMAGSWDHELSKPMMLIAKLVATSVVVFWNFFANKRWTFKSATSQ